MEKMLNRNPSSSNNLFAVTCADIPIALTAALRQFSDTYFLLCHLLSVSING